VLFGFSIGVAVSPRSVAAHDLWLVPDGDARPGMPLTVRANSGMNFPNSVHAPDTAAFLRRVVITPAGSEVEAEAAGKEGDSGLLRFKSAESGVHVVAVETRPRVIELDAEKFNEYLVADGLPHIYRLRAAEKTLDQPARERYSKSPKLIVQVGAGGGGDPCRVVGLPLEIVPLRSPLKLRIGETLAVRVLFQGKPLGEANLGWDLPDDGDAPSGTVRTDARGEALVPIARTGLMTIRLTHMTRPKADDHEWESFWTTLTFRIADSKE
jgi:uncharacterized GH25 family protein